MNDSSMDMHSKDLRPASTENDVVSYQSNYRTKTNDISTSCDDFCNKLYGYSSKLISNRRMLSDYLGPSSKKKRRIRKKSLDELMNTEPDDEPESSVTDEYQRDDENGNPTSRDQDPSKKRSRKFKKVIEEEEDNESRFSQENKNDDDHLIRSRKRIEREDDANDDNGDNDDYYESGGRKRQRKEREEEEEEEEEEPAQTRKHKQVRENKVAFIGPKTQERAEEDKDNDDQVPDDDDYQEEQDVADNNQYSNNGNELTFVVNWLLNKVKMIKAPSPVQFSLSLFSQKITILPSIPPSQSFYLFCVPQRMDENDPDILYLLTLAFHSQLSLYDSDINKPILFDSIELASLSRVHCITMNPLYNVYEPTTIELPLDVVEESPSIDIIFNSRSSTSVRYVVASTVPGYIWCGAYRSNTPIPSIVELMRKPAQFMPLVVEMEETQLAPSSNYRLYCYAESIRGSPMNRRVRDTYISFSTLEGIMSISNWMVSETLLSFTIRSNHVSYPTCHLNGNDPIDENYLVSGDYRFELGTECNYHLLCVSEYDVKDFVIERTFSTCRRHSFLFWFICIIGFAVLSVLFVRWCYPLREYLRVLSNKYETRAILQSQDENSGSEERLLASSEPSWQRNPRLNGEGWRCPSCFNFNRGSSTKCEMCSAVNPRLSEHIQSEGISDYSSSDYASSDTDSESIFAEYSEDSFSGTY